MSDHSFYACLARLQDAMPASWSPPVKHLTQILFRFSKMGTGGGIRVSVETMAKTAGENRRSVYRSLRFLRERGFLIQEGTHVYRNQYGPIFIPVRRLDIDAMKAAKALEESAHEDADADILDDFDTDTDDGVELPKVADGGVTTEPKGCQKALHPRVTGGTHHRTLNQTTEPNEIPNGISHVRACEAMFLAFWSLYPRKEGSRAARRAWEEVTREYNPADILTAIGRHEFAIDPQYIPMAVKWLRDGRFLDQPDGGSLP